MRLLATNMHNDVTRPPQWKSCPPNETRATFANSALLYVVVGYFVPLTTRLRTCRSFKYRTQAQLNCVKRGLCAADVCVCVCVEGSKYIRFPSPEICDDDQRETRPTIYGI